MAVVYQATQQAPLVLPISSDAKGVTPVYKVLCSVFVPSLSKGNVVLLAAMFQGQGHYSHYVGLGRQVVRALNSSDTQGIKRLSSGMDNIIPNTANKVVTVLALDTIDTDTDYYYNLVVDAKGTDAGQDITLYYGFLAAIVL